MDLTDLLTQSTPIMRAAAQHDRTFVVSPQSVLSLVLSLSDTQVVRRRMDGVAEVERARIGSVTVVPIGRPAEFSIEGPSRTVMLHLPWHDVATWITESHGRLALDTGLAARLHCHDQELAKAIYAAASDPTIEGREHAFRRVAERLFDGHLDGAGPAIARTGNTALTRPRLRRAIEFIDAHLAEPLPLARVAGAVGASPFHFARGFEAAVGVPPHQFIIARRAERALVLLGDRALSIADIAGAAGFAHASHLARVIRARTGLNPVELRKAVYE